ncbi:MAG: L-aspartate oxidase [Vicinamibacterales bacterium]
MELRSDFLIIGSGIAALRAVPEVASHGDVLILTKGGPGEGNTGHAQGGIAAAVGPGDTPELHAADTIAAGDGLCDPHAVEVLVGDGPRFVRELISWGVQFDRAPNGELALAMEAAHSARRVLHAHDATGREIGRVLWERASRLARVTTQDHARVVDLVLDDGRCVGARFLTGNGELATALARTVLLATGGAGQVYHETTNPQVATGDGIAMAYRAGAAVIDLEFVQFHPTALMVEGQPRFLLSEALRGEGAQLVNASGEAFMARYEAAGDLAPRDRVSRAIVRESRRTNQPVYLSLAQLDPDFVHKRFPLISGMCRRAGLDLARDRIPVGPAAHYVMGGVQTDLDGRTTIPALFAAGEVACTGVHGANRLASNSLLEGLVFGARAGCAMREAYASVTLPSHVPRASRGTKAGRLQPDPIELTRLMWRDVGLFRDREGLTRALAALEPAWKELDSTLGEGRVLDAEDWRTASIVTVGRLIAGAALRRAESRGGHYRADFPDRDDVHWKKRLAEKRDKRTD